MNFEQSSELNGYLASRGKVILKACPGSGKTTTVAFKLHNLINDAKKGSTSGVACLSFTNVAKNEINEKYKAFSGNLLSYPNTVSTIDSFVNRFITLPYYHLIVPNITRPIILDNSLKLNNISGSWLGYRTLKNQPVNIIYPPSSISIDLKYKFLTKNKRPNLAIISDADFNNYCLDLKNWQRDKGILTNEDSTYFALKILKVKPRIAENLCKRFSHLIIDEAQDTSEIQFEIINELIKNGLKNIELIGDPYQSLYEFRNARPDLFNNKFTDTKWSSHELMKCRRSSQKTIDCYSNLRVIGEKPIKSIAKTKFNYPIHIIFYTEGDEVNLINKYENTTVQFTNNIILVRGNKHLKALGVKISDENPWKTKFPLDLIRAKKTLNDGNVKEAVNKTRIVITELIHPSKKIHELRDMVNEIKKDPMKNIEFLKILRKMPEFSLSLLDWTVTYEKEIENITGLSKTDFELKKGGKWSREKNKKVDEFFSIKTSFKTKIKTIHQVKGMTFDSTLIILSKDNQGQNLSIKQLDVSSTFPDEKKRMIYVALSRARELTCLGIPETITKDELKKVLPNYIEVK